jgi:hypothetical protein
LRGKHTNMERLNTHPSARHFGQKFEIEIVGANERFRTNPLLSAWSTKCHIIVSNERPRTYPCLGDVTSVFDRATNTHPDPVSCCMLYSPTSQHHRIPRPTHITMKLSLPEPHVRAWYWYAFAAEVFAACALVSGASRASRASRTSSASSRA